MAQVPLGLQINRFYGLKRSFQCIEFASVNAVIDLTKPVDYFRECSTKLSANALLTNQSLMLEY